MAVNYGTKIETSGLVLYYDESNVKTGTSSELVLNRAATISGSSSREFASDDLIKTMHAASASYNSSAPSPGTGFTLNVWIRRTGETTGSWDYIVLFDNGGPQYRMIWFGWYFNDTDRIHCSMPYYTASTTEWWSVDPQWSDAGLTLTINQWYNFCASYNNSTRVLNTYINGIFALSGTRPGAGDLNNPSTANIGLYGCNGVSTVNSQLKSVSMYNRPLSAAEVMNNFNAVKGRYGL